MSPTVFRHGPYRFFFFSREEPRVHVHVVASDGEAKFWIEPDIHLAKSFGFGSHQLKEIRDLVHRREKEIRDAWNQHFGS